MHVRDLPRDHRGRVRIFEIATNRVIERQPIDALECIGSGICRFATDEELAALPPMTAPPAGPVSIAEKTAEKPQTGPAADIPERPGVTRR